MILVADDISSWRLLEAYSVPGIVLCAFHVLIHSILSTLEVGAINFPILQIKKLKHREIRSFVQGHMGS